MSNIVEIKQKILQLSPGDFQNLCDAYLSKCGYDNIISLGGEAGTNKTTRGTPDTYFKTKDGKFVFVEYTTQQNKLFSKINNDISKCLNVLNTGVSHDKISEIIYCHTSSDISPKQNDELTNLCKNNGIELIIIGIDQIAKDLYFNYPILARDFLGVPISTYQIQEYQDFVETYNSNKMVAPIYEVFMFRDEEVKVINEAYQKVDIVVLDGSAGVGKTRLALYYSKHYSELYNYKLYCIHSKSLSIYEDLKRYLESPGDYFLLIDDANQLSELQNIVSYANMKQKGYNVKILITVRDYALQKVLNDLSEKYEYENIRINPFSDEKIKKLLESIFNIHNFVCQDKIVRIAEGNTRLAVLAGRIAINTNRLDSISDASQLYDNYFGSFLKKDQILNDNSLYIVAGITAFLETINLDNIEIVLPILQEKGLSRDDFTEKIRALHELGIVDVYYDRVVRFSDQCFANYMIKHVFIDNEFIDLSNMISTCFKVYENRTVYSINTLINVFGNEYVYSFVEDKIRLLWDKLENENNIYFNDFVKSFFRLNPLKTLKLLSNMINLEDNIQDDIENNDVIDCDTFDAAEILAILGGFAELDDFPAALDLFFEYYMKRLDISDQFFDVIIQYFGISDRSIENDYYTQIKLFNKIIDYSDDWNNNSIVDLFLKIIDYFLKFHFSSGKPGRKKTISVCTISIFLTNGVKEYRKLIWEALNTLCKYGKYNDRIRNLLLSYGRDANDINKSVLEFDLYYIKTIIFSYFPSSEIKNCILVERLNNLSVRNDFFHDKTFVEYIENEKYKIYSIFKLDIESSLNYENRKKLMHKSIKKFILEHDMNELKLLIDVYNEIENFDKDNSFIIKEGLLIFFNELYNSKSYYSEMIEYYIKSNTPFNIYPLYLVNKLFSDLPDSEVFRIINENDYSQKNNWLYAYYHELPKSYISKKHINGLYEFLSDEADSKLSEKSYRDVDFLLKYNSIDKDVFYNGCAIILSKIEYSADMIDIYFMRLFDIKEHNPNDIIDRFTDNIELLELIYFSMLPLQKHFDYKGDFLMAIYTKDTSVLKKYIDCFAFNNYKGLILEHNERNKCFFRLNNYLEIYNNIFYLLLQYPKSNQGFVSFFIQSILMVDNNNQDLLGQQDKLIKQCIQIHSSNIRIMFYLFRVILLFDDDRRNKYFSEFLRNNDSIDDFKMLPLIPTYSLINGSLVTIYSSCINLLEFLLPKFVGFKWIDHKEYALDKIKLYKKQIENEHINDILSE